MIQLRKTLAWACALGAAGLWAASAAGQTTAFTYQGRLKAGGVPADGSFDLRFRLYDAVAGGAQVGGTIYVDDKGVSLGLFSTALDFGSSPFPGSDRWVEVSVRPGSVSNADRTEASYTKLDPRQKVTSAPYAIRARDTDMLDSLHAGAFLQGVPNPLTLSGSQPGSHIIQGTNSSTGFTATGVRGEASGASGTTFGLRGRQRDGTVALPTNGAGVFGESDTSHGVVGFTQSINPWSGVWGLALADSGYAHGVRGETLSADGAAVSAMNGNTNAACELGSKCTTTLGGSSTYVAGLAAESPQIGAYVRTSGAGYAAFVAESSGWNGVAGITETGNGVWAEAMSSSGAGLYARGSGVSMSSQGTAIQIVAGGLSVPGAGMNTYTPVFIHEATAGNTSGPITYINHPLTNAKPGAILLVTQNWSAGETYNAHEIAVYYSSSEGQWSIFNEDLTAMPVGTTFNVLVFNDTAAKSADGNALSRDGGGGKAEAGERVKPELPGVARAAVEAAGE